LGLAGDEVADTKHHGGVDQAVYAYAREDLDAWQHELGRPLRSGEFGENLTTVGLDVQNARMGERWQVGSALLEVAGVRIPCSTFQGFLGERAWVKRFTERGIPGAYLRVVSEGSVCVGDQIDVVERRPHDLTVGLTFRALTTRRELLPQLAAEPRVSQVIRHKVEAAGKWQASD
jgi:MOSC domain-containing protein YiiM